MEASGSGGKARDIGTWRYKQAQGQVGALDGIAFRIFCDVRNSSLKELGRCNPGQIMGAAQVGWNNATAHQLGKVLPSPCC